MVSPLGTRLLKLITRFDATPGHTSRMAVRCRSPRSGFSYCRILAIKFKKGIRNSKYVQTGVYGPKVRVFRVSRG